MQRAKLYMSGAVVLPYQTAVKIMGLLQEAQGVDGYGCGEKLSDKPYITLEPYSDIRYKAVSEAPIYGINPNELEEKLIEFKRKPKLSIEDHPDLLS